MAELTVVKDKISLKGVKDFGSPFVLIGSTGTVDIKSSTTTKAFLVGSSIERVLLEDDSVNVNGEYGIYGENTTLLSLLLTGDLTDLELRNNKDLKVLSVDALELNKLLIEGSLIEDLRLKAITSEVSELNLNKLTTLSYLFINLPPIQNIGISDCRLLRELHLYNYNNSIILLNTLSSLRVIELVNSAVIELDLSHNEQLTDLTIKSSDVSDIKISKSLKYVYISSCSNLTIVDFQNADLLNDILLSNCHSLNTILLKGSMIESNQSKLTTMINSLESRIGLTKGEIKISDIEIANSLKDLAATKNWTLVV